MPERYVVEFTERAFRLSYQWVHEDAVPEAPLGEGSGPGGVAPIVRFSARSRMNMRWKFSGLPWDLLGPRPAMLTFTYPGREWRQLVPDGETLKAHREAFKERWRKAWGPPVGVWVLEFQKSGAPHMHMYLGLPDAVSDAEFKVLRDREMMRRRLEQDLGKYEARSKMRAPKKDVAPFAHWVRDNWTRVVGKGEQVSASHYGHGANITPVFWTDEVALASNVTRIADYFWRESGKWGQKEPPEGFMPGRWWGVWGERRGFKPRVVEADLSKAEWHEVRRISRRLRMERERAVATRLGRRPGRGKKFSARRQGLTVFDIDANDWTPRLLAAARLAVAGKPGSVEEG